MDALGFRLVRVWVEGAGDGDGTARGGCLWERPRGLPREDALTTVAVEKPEALAFFNAIPDADGCVSFDAGTDGPGTYGVKVYQLFRNKNTLMGATTLPVQ